MLTIEQVTDGNSPINNNKYRIVEGHWVIVKAMLKQLCGYIEDSDKVLHAARLEGGIAYPIDAYIKVLKDGVTLTLTGPYRGVIQMDLRNIERTSKITEALCLADYVASTEDVGNGSRKRLAELVHWMATKIRLHLKEGHQWKNSV